MRSILFSFFLLLIVTRSFSQTIKVNLNNAFDSAVNLYYSYDNAFQQIDTLKLDSKGAFSQRFHFKKMGKVKMVCNNALYEFVLFPNSQLSVTGDITNSSTLQKSINITGPGSEVNISQIVNYSKPLTEIQWDYDLPPDKFVARLTAWRNVKDSIRKAVIAEKVKRPYSKNVSEFLRADSLNDLYWTIGGFRDYHSYVLGRTSTEDSFFVENVKPHLVFTNDEAILASDIYRGIWNKYIADQYTWKRNTKDSIQVKDKDRIVFRLEEVTKQIPGKLREIVLGRMIQDEYASNYRDISESKYSFYDSVLNVYGKRLTNQMILQQAISAVNTTKQMRKVTAKGMKAPDFSLIDTSGKIVSLSDFKGKVVYLDTWASWCAPCIAQIPSYRKLVERFNNRKDIVFLCVSIDDNRPAWIEKGVNKHSPPGLQLWSGPKGGNSEFVKQYFITGIPKQILIDKEGRILNYNAESPESKNVDKSIGEALGL